MDIFCEHMVKRKKQKIDFVLESILVLVATYLSFICLALSSVLKSITLLVIAAIWYGAVYLIRKKNIEYEYILTNNIFDIDRIFAKRSRKRATTIDIATIDYIRPIDNSDYKKNPEIEYHNLCECKESKNTYVLMFYRDGKGHKVFFTPNDKMKRKLKELNPAKVTVVLDEE